MSSHDLIASLDRRITEISRTVFDEAIANYISDNRVPDGHSEGLRRQIALIKSKEHITVKEAALLMSCSDSHIRKMVTLARKRKSTRPIPFVELEGMTVFPLADLLAWAKPQTRLHVVKNDAA